jgi:dienelactone hydrolase
MMKKLMVILLSILLLAGCGSQESQTTPSPLSESPSATATPDSAEVRGNTPDASSGDTTGAETDINQMAINYVTDLSEGNFKKVVEEYPYDATMKSIISEAMLRDQLWGFFTSTFGEFRRILETQSQKVEEYSVIGVKTEFEKSKIYINVVFDKDNRIAGINYALARDEAEIPGNITETQVTFGKSGWELPATLTIPKEGSRFPVVILVHGSGPNDRDETVGANKPFRDIAWGLAQKGIATLRYDKRTYVYSKELAALSDASFYDETDEDAILALEFLKSNPSIDLDKIYILGHSQGGMLIPRIAAKSPDAAGYIILAGPALPLNEIMVDQIKYLSGLDGTLSDEDKRMIAEYEAMNENVIGLTSDSDLTADKLLGLTKSYWLDIKDYHPAEAAKAIEKPLMILQGGRDYQVVMENFNVWKAALGDKPNVSFKLYDTLNHLFISGSGDPNPQEYFIEGKVDQRVIDDIIDFIQ